MFETSAEWPHLAAIERERRQRAALAFEQSLRARNLVLTRQSSRGRQYLLQTAQPSRQTGRRHASDEVLVERQTDKDVVVVAGGGGGGDDDDDVYFN